MGYYGQGDYYARGGIWDVIKGVGTVLTRGVGAVTNPLGTAVSTFSNLGGGGGGIPVIKTPGVRGAAERFLPGGATGYQVGPDGMPRKRRRRINPANAKALNRANRRVDAFVRMAKRSLKHTNYKLVSKSAGKGRRRPQVLVETGSGSINAR